jgi:hypothetical protein
VIATTRTQGNARFWHRRASKNRGGRRASSHGVPSERPHEPLVSELGQRFETFYGQIGNFTAPGRVTQCWIREAIKKMSKEDTGGGFIDIDISKAIVSDASQTSVDRICSWLLLCGHRQSA